MPFKMEIERDSQSDSGLDLEKNGPQSGRHHSALRGLPGQSSPVRSSQSFLTVWASWCHYQLLLVHTSPASLL